MHTDIYVHTYTCLHSRACCAGGGGNGGKPLTLNKPTLNNLKKAEEEMVVFGMAPHSEAKFTKRRVLESLVWFFYTFTQRVLCPCLFVLLVLHFHTHTHTHTHTLTHTHTHAHIHTHTNRGATQNVRHQDSGQQLSSSSALAPNLGPLFVVLKSNFRTRIFASCLSLKNHVPRRFVSGFLWRRTCLLFQKLRVRLIQVRAAGGLRDEG